MFKNILVPIDGSAYALSAVKAAVAIGEKFEGRVTLLHVITKSPEIESKGKDGPEIQAQQIEALRAEGCEILNQALKSIDRDAANIDAILSWGNPANIIIEEVAEKKHDLVVMGNRGLGAIKGLLLGSVSERVSRAVKCPVLIIKDVSYV